jgi:hypothetical protein
MIRRRRRTIGGGSRPRRELRWDESIVHLAVWGRWQGWSQHELVHLHRAAKALRDAGLCLKTDSGKTDEGEPWFVFWDADSCEVIVHIARINRKYVVWFPNRNDSLSGRVLRDLIERLLELYLGPRNETQPALD